MKGVLATRGGGSSRSELQAEGRHEKSSGQEGLELGKEGHRSRRQSPGSLGRIGVRSTVAPVCTSARRESHTYRQSRSSSPPRIPLHG